MAKTDSPEHVEESLSHAFKSGNKSVAEHLLSCTQQDLSAVRTMFYFIERTISSVSLLHVAAYWGWGEIVAELITVHNCGVGLKDDEGNIPLHYAAYNGKLKIVTYFTTKHLCDPESKNGIGNTPLHLACINGQLEIIQYLINELHCNPSCENNFNSTPLHLSCIDGHLKTVQYLIRETNCNPSSKNRYGDTPLHTACFNGHLDITQYLISEVNCNPSCKNKNGTTPLHVACIRNHVQIVKYLLFTGRLNPLAENKYGSTPLSYSSGKYDIIKLFEPFENCRISFPLHTFTKLILVGDSGAGKTTLANLVMLLASSSGIDVECVKDVDRFTAGIIPRHIESNFGNFVVYDFAGQQDYHSSHAAIMEQVMHKSAALFLCLVDLSKTNESICQSLQYWLSFINIACSSTEGKSRVVIVGSHADLVKSNEEMKEKNLILQTLATTRVKHQEFGGYVTMDCRQVDTDVSSKLINILTMSHKAITAFQPVINFYCHVLYAFLQTKLNVVGCTLQYLISAVSKENDSSIPNDPSVLTEFLTTLSDRGFILFLKYGQSSWIVVKIEALLNDINGTLFAPCHFKEHCDLSSNTGIVPASNLCEVFPQYNPEMLLGFLESLDFCRPVDHSVLQYTNLRATHSTSNLLFFPGLVLSERPGNIIFEAGMLQFGWCLGCIDEHQFLSSRFLHVLLLFVAYKFPLASRFTLSHGLQRMCTIWRNGITWRNDDNITTVIELLNNNRWLIVAISYDEERVVEFAQLRGHLISLVRHLQQERCPSVKVCEFLISPNLIQQYPFDNLPDTDLFDIHHVARSILRRKPVVLSYKDGRGYIKTQMLSFEPYLLLEPLSVCQLFNPNMSNQCVPAILLHKVQKLCHYPKMKPQVFAELREYLDSLSMFAGRNPMVRCAECTVTNQKICSQASCLPQACSFIQEVAELEEEDILSDSLAACEPCNTLSETTHTARIHVHTKLYAFFYYTGIGDLFEVKVALKDIVDWQSLGLALGLLYPTLKKIETENHEKIDKCITEMLAAWLQQKDDVARRGVPSWLVLKTALSKIGAYELASKIDT